MSSPSRTASSTKETATLNSASEIDPLLPLNKDQTSQQPSTTQYSSIPSNLASEQATTNLETAANDVYEALVENDTEYDEDEHNEDVIWLREQRLLNKTMHWLKRPSVLMISSITFLLAFSVSSAESTRQIITLKLACNSLGTNKCTKDSAQILMSDLQLGYTITGAIIMLISSGKVAPLSDLYGRKIFIVATLTCFFLGKCIKFLLMYNFETLKFYPMIASEALTNLCGGLMAIIALSNCYISDVVEPHQRIYSLGISIAAMFVGLSIGPLFGNLVTSLTTKFAKGIEIPTTEFIPLKIELVFILFDVLIAVFILPESRSKKARKKSRSLSRSSSQVNLQLQQQQKHEQPSFSRRFINQINFLKPIKLLYLPRDLVNEQNRHRINRDRFAIIVLVLIDCSLTTLAISFGEIYLLYGIYNYNWDQSNIGQLLAIGCASKAIVLIILSPMINHKILQHGFGFKVFKKQIDMVDFSMCLLGLCCEVIGFFGYSIAPSTTVFFIFTVFCGFGTLISPAVNSSIVKFYPESKIGELFGAMALVKNLFALVSPIFYLSIYKYSIKTLHKPGLVFVVAGTVLFICTLMLITVKRVLKLDKNTEAFVPSRSNSFVEFDQTRPPPSPEQLQHRGSFSELHKKNSFVQKERTGP
ncbi:uncharacterized protein KGF55_002569 [Candida pseudojiufengensis]|uniref:uncharacterized protein n=1 Tax=Candida pseudojiufengensis TaxID=497109 RepID=UPI002224F312|nr:uncharacterized protein KGF55_002569 [Candida pseudojiufengensis]KAI5963689.1 hypothetical protein KGF55_002569 [Candida pseudojiufengensis]